MKLDPRTALTFTVMSERKIYYMNPCTLLTGDQLQAIVDQTNHMIEKNEFYDSFVNKDWRVHLDADDYISLSSENGAGAETDLSVIFGYMHVLQSQILANFDEYQLSWRHGDPN